MIEELDIRNKEIAAINHYFSIERYGEARKHIESLFSLNPTDPLAYYYMAIVYYSDGDMFEAREYCEKALMNGYDEETSFHFIGTTYDYEKKYREAEEFYLKALEVNPESGEIHASYGYMMLKAGHEQKSMVLLEAALKLEPESDRVNQYVLQYYFAKSNKQEQLHYIEKVMETGSSEMQKLLNLALFHELKEEDREAREYYRQAFLLDPTNEYLLYILDKYDRKTHPLFFPERMMKKLGGPAVIWLGFIVLVFVLKYLKLYIPLVIFAGIYVAFCVYTWFAPVFYKLFVKGRH
jgi:tetratricopeptide (TPR) repeat protein